MGDCNINIASRRILVVDDDSSIADLVKEALGREGYSNVRIAGTGLEAVRICREQPPELIVLGNH